MKKNILKLFYLPIVMWILFSVLYFSLIYVAIKEHVEQNSKIIKNLILTQEEQRIKNSVKFFKNTFLFFKNGIYSCIRSESEDFINLLIKNHINKLYINDTFVFGLLPQNKRFKYEIKDNRYIILNYHNKKYIVSFKNKGKKIYIFGIRKSYIDNLILYYITQYLNKINKNNPSYIALGKILTFNPKKDGVFGYLYYMPPSLENLVGLKLSVNKPDFKGHLFRKKYLECLKKGKGCFVSYYWINPLTHKIEEKISYFDYFKDYNLSIVEGIYKSQILNRIHNKINRFHESAFEIFYGSVIVYFAILVFFIIIQMNMFGRVKDKLIKEYEDMNNELLHSLYYDSLTNLPNRNKLFKNIKEFESLIILDLENFSDINDVFGFDFGDDLLKNFAKYLKENYDFVYRIGNDEFAIATKEKINEDFIKKLLENKFEFYGIKVDFILGASNYKKRLYETAEMALKIALKNPNKRYILYDENIYQQQKNKIYNINLLKEALERENIIPYYQCIVNQKGEVTKYEALMRIKIDNEIKSPFYFMDLIKEARLYNDFSKIMIKKVFKDLEKLDKKVSINLSYDDLADEEMRNFIFNLINEKNAKRIVFEILESESLLNFDLVKSFIEKVSKKGVEIAIDDFGSGYSNFVRVLDLNPNIIKIDASLVKNINNDKYKKMIELIVNFAKNYGLKVVAEFVSDKEKFEILKQLSVDEYQGFYFCEPEPLENILKKDKISSKKGNNEN